MANDITGASAPTTMRDTAAPAAETTTAPAAAAKPNTTDPNEAFARKERQIRRMQQELQQQRQQLEAKAKSYETDYVPKSRLKEDFWGAAEELGIDYNTATEQMLTRPNDPATKALMAQVKALQDKFTSQEKQAQEAQAAQYQAAVKQIGDEVKMLVDADPEFESIKTAGMHDAVVELIEQTYHAEGRLMDVKEAALEIENHLIEEAFKMAQLSKVQARLKPKVEEPVAPPARPQAKPIATITNRMQQEQPKMSADKEKRARAIAAFMGNKTN